MLQRIEEVAPSLVATFTLFIYQFTHCVWNKTTIEALISVLSEADIPTSSRTVAHTLLKDLAHSHSNLFKHSIPILANWIISVANELSPNRSMEDKLAAEDVLKALSRLIELDLPGKQGRDFVDALKNFALHGETEKQGRSATAVLLKLKRRNLYADDLVRVTSIPDHANSGNCPISKV